jgi:hypothetical protein
VPEKKEKLSVISKNVEKHGMEDFLSNVGAL